MAVKIPVRASKPDRASLVSPATRARTTAAVGSVAEGNAKLREVPQAAYALLSRAAAPLTAYDLIEGVQKRLHRRLHPPTIYRALSQLLARGLVHRLESSGSYIACASPGEPHHSILFLCNRCGNAEEGDDARVHALLLKDASARGFLTESEVIEVRGICTDCQAGIEA